MKTPDLDTPDVTYDPATIADSYLAEIRRDVAALNADIRVIGLIASHDKPSLSYARATREKFKSIGIDYELRAVERLDLENEILALNEDPGVHGIFIYFPIFHNEQDSYLRNLVDYRKDIEAGSQYWTRKLYANDRTAIKDDPNRKAVLPCTPLAIIKMLTAIGEYDESQSLPVAGKTVSIFNRSEVIGRPLAVMMSNDGARVYSFDENGPLLFVDARPMETSISRAEALAESDMVITGVPSDKFERIQASEIKPEAVCLNFSSVANFANNIPDYSRVYIPKVGPMTVAMCMRNTIRLFKNFHAS